MPLHERIPHILLILKGSATRGEANITYPIITLLFPQAIRKNNAETSRKKIIIMNIPEYFATFISIIILKVLYQGEKRNHFPFTEPTSLPCLLKTKNSFPTYRYAMRKEPFKKQLCGIITKCTTKRRFPYKIFVMRSTFLKTYESPKNTADIPSNKAKIPLKNVILP